MGPEYVVAAASLASGDSLITGDSVQCAVDPVQHAADAVPNEHRASTGCFMNHSPAAAREVAAFLLAQL